MILTVVGAGGKTSLLRVLTRRYREEGRRVLVTTTTRMYVEEETLLTRDPEEILRRMEGEGWALAGTPAGEKMGPLPPETYEAVCAHADMVLVEGDGSRHRPIKLPGPGEPVIPANTGEIAVVCGMHALNRPLGDGAHRPEMAAEFLGVGLDTPVTPEHILRLVEEGYCRPLARRYPRQMVWVVAAHDGSPEQLAGVEALRMLGDFPILPFRLPEEPDCCGGWSP